MSHRPTRNILKGSLIEGLGKKQPLETIKVPRQEVWRCMREKGVPEKYVMIVQDMYEGARTWVKSSVALTDMIPVCVGLHQ